MDEIAARAAWAEPAHRLWRMPVDAPAPIHADNGGPALRLPTERDVPTLARYAPESAAYGTWLPVGRLDVDPLTWAAWFVRELRLGWTMFGGRHGGGLFADSDSTELAAYLNFVPLRPGVVELCYGVAPEARGRGIASMCADVAARWALSAGFERVELHISADHAESRRVATKASFVFAKAVKKRVEATGHEYDDVIYLRTGETE